MSLMKNKRGQWATIAARERRSYERSQRKTLARVLKLLGFDINEITNFLNVSTQTTKTYLKETKDIVYSDLAEQVYQEDIFNMFSEKEQELLEKCKELSVLASNLSDESKKISKIIYKQNFFGKLIHKFGDIEQYKARQKEINNKVLEIGKDSNKISKKLLDKKLCPHISRSNLKLSVKKTQAYHCEFCGKEFETFEKAEKHEINCEKK